MLSFVNENFDSFKNVKEKEDSGDNESSHSTNSDISQKEEDTKKETSSMFAKKKAIKSPSRVKYIKAKASTQSEKETSVDGSTKESEKNGWIAGW